jgi:long-subunit acyl-CoA synthetase (AMP-forming)
MDDEGELYIIDRVRDMQTMKSGEKFSPTYIEGRLKFSPFIKDVMVIGAGPIGLGVIAFSFLLGGAAGLALSLLSRHIGSS